MKLFSVEINLFFRCIGLKKIFVNLRLFSSIFGLLSLHSVDGLFVARVFFVVVLIDGAVVVLEEGGVVREQSLSAHDTRAKYLVAAFCCGFRNLLLHSFFCLLLLPLGSVRLPFQESVQSDWDKTLTGKLVTLLFNLFLKRHFLVRVFVTGHFYLSVLHEHVACWESVHVVAVVAVVGADPIETIQVSLNRIDKVLASDNSVGDLGNLNTWVSINVDV